MQEKLDSRLIKFGKYLEEKISEQKNRPYKDKMDIEINLDLYENMRGLYQRMINGEHRAESLQNILLLYNNTSLSDLIFL